MRFNYGILPKIMVFQRPNHFKFRVKQEGVFIHVSGSIIDLWTSLTNEFKRAREIKKYSNTGNYGEVRSFFDDHDFQISSPWAIEVKDGIQKEPLENFKPHIEEKFWEFSVSEFNSHLQVPHFEAELIDNHYHERLNLASKNDTIRVYPREKTDIDQSIRIFNFMSDHFDSECIAREVV